MTSRDEFYERGRDQERLAFGEDGRPYEPVLDFVPGLGRMVTEMLYGNIWSRPGLTPRERSLATVAALAVRLRYGQLEAEIASALRRDVKPEEIVEAIVMTVYYAGFSGAIPALEVARKVFDALSVTMPDLPDDRDLAELEAGGRARRTQVQGGVFDESYPTMSEVAPELGTIITRWGWGYIWGRPGLDVKARILVGIAGLASLGPPAAGPLPLFFRGAVRNGYSKEQIVEILLQIMFYVGVPPVLWSLSVAADALAAQ